MNNDQDLYRDSFTIHMQDSSSREPSFILTLTPNIQDYSNQESKNKDYIKAETYFTDEGTFTFKEIEKEFNEYIKNNNNKLKNIITQKDFGYSI